MTLTIEERSCKPLAILIHPGSPNDTKIFDDMLSELKRRRILKKWQLILCDRGFYSLENYLIGINKYEIVLFIFPKKKPSLITLIERIQNPLEYYTEEKYKNQRYEKLKQKLFSLLPKWEDFRRRRWKIEEFFKFIKIELKLKEIHAYTKRAVYKHVYLNVFLMGIMINTGYREIEEITNLLNFT
ncbi:MAG: transposase [Methanobrevibacter sp.]|nr:transposase [Methanobrevibacter sp.]